MWVRGRERGRRQAKQDSGGLGGQQSWEKGGARVGSVRSQGADRHQKEEPLAKMLRN